MAKKLYYKIGEACKALDIQPYVLRYWEKEFPVLSPNKSKSGQRVYSEREIEIIRRIKELLYDEGYTIAGAKKKLEAELAAGDDGPLGADAAASSPPEDPRERSEVDSGTVEELEKLRSGIGDALSQAREILALLKPNATRAATGRGATGRAAQAGDSESQPR